MSTRTTAVRAAGSGFHPTVFLLSFGVLLLEVSYTRVFSFKLFYYFTYLIIGLALLGLGVGGVLIAVSPRLRRTPTSRVALGATLVAATGVLVGYVVVARTPLNAIALARMVGVHDLRSAAPELAKLVLACASVFLPMCAAGMGLAKIFASHPEDVNRLYAADLFGAALGCVASVQLLRLLTPPGCVLLAGLVFLLAGVPFAVRARGALALVVPLGVLLVIGVGAPGRLPDPVPDRVKTLGPDTRGKIHVLFSRWSPVFRVDVFPNPFDASNFMIAHDGMAGSALHRFDGAVDSLSRFEVNPRAYPFRFLAPQPRVAIIGAAGGQEILAALYFGAAHVTGVELNPVTVSLLTTHFADLTGHLAEHPRVTLVNAEGRSFLRRDERRYDLIWLVAPDTYAAMNSATSGAFVLSESYLYTAEMLLESFRHLGEDGILCAQFGEADFERKPNRTLRFLSTARAAFRRMGLTDFGRHVLVTISPDFFATYSTVLLRKTPFNEHEVRRLDEITPAVEGAQVYFPPPPGAPEHPIVTVTVGSDAEVARWQAKAPFEVGPVTDDAPFFWHFVRFRDVARPYGTSFNPEEATGERLLLILLALVSLFAAATLFLPMARLGVVRREMPGKALAALYFAAVGLGFMLIEVTLIQRFTLFLGYPTHTLTVTLFALLAATAVGSFGSARWKIERRRALGVLGSSLVVLLVFYRYGLGPLIEAWIGAPFPARVGLAIVLMAPLGVCLGAFLPLGLRTVAGLSEQREEALAWAWAVNAFFSVVGSILATVLSMALGFAAVLMIAGVVYGVGIAALATIPDARAGR